MRSTPGHKSRKNYNSKKKKNNTSTPMFIIAKIWKQSKDPSTFECIKKMCYIYTMEYHSAFRRNEIMPFSAI